MRPVPVHNGWSQNSDCDIMNNVHRRDNVIPQQSAAGTAKQHVQTQEHECPVNARQMHLWYPWRHPPHNVGSVAETMHQPQVPTATKTPVPITHATSCGIAQTYTPRQRHGNVRKQGLRNAAMNILIYLNMSTRVQNGNATAAHNEVFTI